MAETGFTAFAPDLYHGKIAENIPDAERLSSAVFANIEKTQADVAQAVNFIEEKTDLKRHGLSVIGFSLGAYFALDVSVTDTKNVRPVVIFYGTRPGDYSDSTAAHLGHSAETDKFEPPEEVEALKANLLKAGRSAIFYNYPGIGHWFFEPDRTDAFNKTAADLAWERTLAFLRGKPHSDR